MDRNETSLLVGHAGSFRPRVVYVRNDEGETQCGVILAYTHPRYLLFLRRFVVPVVVFLPSTAVSLPTFRSPSPSKFARSMIERRAHRIRAGLSPQLSYRNLSPSWCEAWDRKGGLGKRMTGRRLLYCRSRRRARSKGVDNK